MAQRAIIGINGELSPFDESLAKLRTPGIGGDSITWVPHNDTLCAALTVRANGTYNAADKNVYGFDYVAVSVPGESVTGKDPTTGQEVVVSKDPDTGEIVETVVPVEIRVITPPTNPYGVYVDGQTISTDGMVVKAYDSKGNEMLTVPLGQITINPTVAVFDESKDQGGRMIGEGVVALILSPSYDIANKTTYYYGQAGSETQIRSSRNTSGVTLYLTEYHGNVYGMIKGDESAWIGYMSPTLTGAASRYNNQYFSGSFIDTTIAGLLPHSSLSPAGKTVDDMEMIPAGSPQTITVSWPRPGDGAILETTFDILVGPSSGN